MTHPGNSAQATIAARPRASAEVWSRLCLLAFGLIWVVEIYWTQRHTLINPENAAGIKYYYLSPIIRLGLDVLFVASLTLILRRWMLALASVVVFGFNVAILSYYSYFHRPLSMLTFMYSWQGPSQLKPFAWGAIPKGVLLVLVLVLLAKLFLLKTASFARFSPRVRWLGAAGCFAVYLLALIVINPWDPLDKIRTTRGVGRLGHLRGYIEPWAAEWWYLGRRQLLEDAIALRNFPSDQLTPLETAIPIRRRLVIIQAESLDNHNLGLVVDGKEVTPFLNQLAKQSLRYRVKVFHTNGSADSDFVTLCGARPVNQLNMFSLPGYPYEKTLPEFLARHGYKTTALHGNEGTFYDRRAAYGQMGFSKIVFEEEMVDDFGLPLGLWGVRDEDAFKLSKQLMKESEPGQKIAHFLITLTTHTDYTFLEPQPDDIFPNPRTKAERYINNMHYLDRCLRDYITPLRDATVMIYADHSADREMMEHGFSPDRDDVNLAEYVPCLIYDTEEDLSFRQQTSGIATSGKLNLLDMVTYLRNQVERGSANSPSVPQDAAPITRLESTSSPKPNSGT